ncbi:MAG: hypothetical protein ACK559_38160 [bacterium]
MPPPTADHPGHHELDLPPHESKAAAELQTLGCTVSPGRLAWSQGDRRPKHPPGLAHDPGSSSPTATPAFRCR